VQFRGCVSLRRFPRICDVAAYPDAQCTIFTATHLPSSFSARSTGAVNKVSPERVHLAVRDCLIDKQSDQTRRSVDAPTHQDPPVRHKRQNGKKIDTHILISSCVANQILNNVLCCTCTHSSPSSWALHWHLRPATLPRILPIFVSLPLIGKAGCKFTVPCYTWNNNSGGSDRVRHVFDRRSLGGTLIDQQLGTIERRLGRIQNA